MKTTILFLLAIVFSISTQAQLDNILKRTKNKINNKIDQKIDRAIDNTINGADKTVSGTVSKSKTKSSDDDNAESEENESEDTKTSGKSSAKKSLAVSGKFDFVPGEKVMYVEDFSQDNLGDFPAKWNTNASGELVRLNDQPNKFLEIKKDAVFYPEFVKNMPDNFTCEFDIASTDKFSYYSGGFHIGFTSDPNVGGNWRLFDRFGSRMHDTKNTVEIMLHPTNAGGQLGKLGINSVADGKLIVENDTDQGQFRTKDGKTFAHVSIWRQKTRIRVYINDEKVFDLPRALPEGGSYKSVYFRADDIGNDDDGYYFSNFKLAVGEPDTRNKLITEGKFVTTGILFDVNSAKVKAESYGVIKDIANVLSENADVKVQIVGHTDSDGDDASNLALSKKRAEAVKAILESNYGISGSRLSTDGKGESQPVDKATTAEAKANNRRVEFIKQ